MLHRITCVYIIQHSYMYMYYCNYIILNLSWIFWYNNYYNELPSSLNCHNKYKAFLTYMHCMVPDIVSIRNSFLKFFLREIDERNYHIQRNWSYKGIGHTKELMHVHVITMPLFTSITVLKCNWNASPLDIITTAACPNYFILEVHVAYTLVSLLLLRHID